MDMDTFDPYSDDDVDPPTSAELEAMARKKLAELRETLSKTANDPDRIHDLKMQIYLERLELTRIKRWRELGISKPAAPK